MLASCSRPQRPALERVVLLPFENLTGDPQLDWIRGAMPKIIGAQLNGTAHTLPLLAGSVRDATLLHATRILHGYFDRRKSGLHFEASLEDTDSHRMALTASTDLDALHAADAAAKIVDASAQPFSTSNPQAVEAWARGEAEKATSLDSDFGPAWIASMQGAMTARDTAKAIRVAEQALSRSSLRTPIERAQLELEASNLKQDYDARSKAIVTLSKLVPNDDVLMNSLVKMETAARRYPQAASLLEKLAAASPGNSDYLNTLGYTYGAAGNVAKARETLARYGTLLGTNNANAADSLGDVLFMNGDFAGAEKQYLAASAKNPQAGGGLSLLKAAFAHWLAGDLSGADSIFQNYVQLRDKLGDKTTGIRKAQWLYATGRKADAEKALQTPGSDPNAVNALLTIWNHSDQVLPSDPVRLRISMEQADPSTDGVARVLLAEQWLKSGRKQDAQDLARLWPVPANPDDVLMQTILMPRYLALRERLR